MPLSLLKVADSSLENQTTWQNKKDWRRVMCKKFSSKWKSAIVAFYISSSFQILYSSKLPRYFSSFIIVRKFSSSTWWAALQLAVQTDLQTTQTYVFIKFDLRKRINLFVSKGFKMLSRDGQLPKDKNFYIDSNHFKEDCFQRDFQISNSMFVELFLSCW